MNVSLSTVFVTERLKIRPVALSDVDVVWEASRVPGFNNGMSWDPPETRAAIVEMNRNSIEAWKLGQDYVFTIALLGKDKPIGRIGLQKGDAPGSWNMGFWIHPEHWGRGYAPEAAGAVLDFAFNTLAATCIVASHALWNTRSQAVIERLGFRYVGVNPAGLYKGGQPVEEREYELTRP